MSSKPRIFLVLIKSWHQTNNPGSEEKMKHTSFALLCSDENYSITAQNTYMAASISGVIS